MSELLQDFAVYLRANAVVGRESIRIGAFTLVFDRENDSAYHNYAVPDEDAEPKVEDVEMVVKAFQARQRIPRMEYFPALSEYVEPALTAAGFTVDDVLPVMACTADTLAPKPTAKDVRVRAPRTRLEYRAVASAQHAAFDDPTLVAEAEVDRLRDLVTVDGIVALALVAGEPAGGGLCDTIHHAYGELAGVGVRPEYQGRGVGAAITHYLADRAFKTGAGTVFLTATTDAERRLAERVGFSVFAEHVHASIPA